MKNNIPELDRDMAGTHLNLTAEPDAGFNRVLIFHQVMGLPVAEKLLVSIPVSGRLLRGKLLVEEVLETLHAMGLRLDESLQVVHVEGWVYDPVETLDGLADIKVIVNGTAVAFGLPMEDADDEVFCSNMSKLDESGNPVRNVCQESEPCHLAILNLDCEHLLDPTKPVGKLLKPAKYVPANITRVIAESAIAQNNQNEVLDWIEFVNTRKGNAA